MRAKRKVWGSSKTGGVFFSRYVGDVTRVQLALIHFFAVFAALAPVSVSAQPADSDFLWILHRNKI